METEQKIITAGNAHNSRHCSNCLILAHAIFTTIGNIIPILQKSKLRHTELVEIMKFLTRILSETVFRSGWLTGLTSHRNGIKAILKWRYLKYRRCRKKPFLSFRYLTKGRASWKWDCHKSPLQESWQPGRLVISTRERNCINTHYHQLSYPPFVSIES